MGMMVMKMMIFMMLKNNPKFQSFKYYSENGKSYYSN